MANPSPRLENLRPPWQPGTSGNPAGYSRGRRISDVIKTQIDELGLTQEFAASAIAVALGYKQVLKRNVQDPETGKDIWVELKPDLAWFKLILKIIEPPAQKPDDMAVLNALRAEYDRERRAQADQGHASESPERSRSDPGNCDEKIEPAGKLCQGATAPAGSGQVVAFLAAQLAGLFTGDIRRFLCGSLRIRPRSGHGLSAALAAIGVVAFFMLSYQAVVVDHQGACDHVVRQAAVVADQQDGSQVVHQERSENRSHVRAVVARQADDPPATLLTRPTLSVLSPVLAPKGDSA